MSGKAVSFGPITELSFEKEESPRSLIDKHACISKIHNGMLVSSIIDWNIWVKSVRDREIYEGEFDCIIGKVHRIISNNGQREEEFEDNGEVDKNLRLAKKLSVLNKETQALLKLIKPSKYDFFKSSMPAEWT